MRGYRTGQRCAETDGDERRNSEESSFTREAAQHVSSSQRLRWEAEEHKEDEAAKAWPWQSLNALS